MSNKKLEQGLNGLLATPTPQEPKQETKQGKQYETVCWNLPPNDIENVKRIAKYEGKRINAVVSEALNFYFDNWKPVPQEKPTLLPGQHSHRPGISIKRKE